VLKYAQDRTMKRLWTPWRMEYIQSPKQEGCVFCQALEQEDGPDNLIIFRGKTAFVMLNAFPYTSGHVMVLPFIHARALADLDAETRAELIELTAKATRVLKKVYQAQGFNVGINLGEAAGAGIEEHIHVHIVPRWVGDTNFMVAVGETRMLPEDLHETYRRIKAGWV
jgi:ATP adenylyltransferase